MISYIPIKVDNLDLVQKEIYTYSKTLFDVDSKCRVKMNVKEMINLPSIYDMLKDLAMLDHIEMIYIFTIEPGYRTEVHVDVIDDHKKFEHLSYNFLVPLFGNDESYRNYYSLKENASGTIYKEMVTYYNKNDTILDYRIRTTYPTIHNIRYPHDFENLSKTQNRSMCSFRLRNTWQLKYSYIDYNLSPYNE